MISRWVDVPSDTRRSLSHEEHFLKQLLWKWLWSWFHLAWNFRTVFFHLCKLGTKQNHICTKGSYLVITLHGFCAGQNHKVMCKAEEVGMNFFHNQVFFWACLQSVRVGHLWLGCSEWLQPLLMVISCFHFSAMLRTYLMWYFPAWTEIQPQDSFCFTCFSAPLLLLKVALTEWYFCSDLRLMGISRPLRELNDFIQCSWSTYPEG